MNIRNYIDSDLDDLIDLYKEAFNSIPTSRQVCYNKMQELLSSGNYKVYVLDNFSKLVGACVIYIHKDPFDKDFATIWYFAINKNYRGEGLGSTLLEYVKNDLRKHNLNELILTTAPTNFACQKASEKAGYEKRLSYKYDYNK